MFPIIDRHTVDRAFNLAAFIQNSHILLWDSLPFAVLWAGLGWMSLQFGFFARLTWWEYSWDIMEPVTYFVGYGTSILIFTYFVLTRQVHIII